MLLTDERVGQAFLPHYRVDGILGDGATAVVYAAVDVRTGQPVAIKWLRPGIMHDSSTTRFLREIAIVRSLEHPHLVSLLDHGEADGRPYAVMPLVAGETLRARLTREPQLPFADVVRIASQVAEAIDYAHARGVLHRDIKPENIMLSDSRAFVLDFGVARALEEVVAERITLTGVAVGTPYYMSPEQAAADPHVDGRTDVYSLACVVYEMLVGEPPFTGATMHAVRARQMLEPPGHVRVVRAELPESVDLALQRGLAKAPAGRQRSCRSLVRELTDTAAPTGRSRRRMLWAVAAVAVAALAAFFMDIGAPADPVAPPWLLISRVDASPRERELAAAVEELLRSEFSRSSRLAIVSKDQVRQALRAASLPDTTTLTASRAREVALRSSVKLIVTGTVHRLGEHRVSLTAGVVTADSLHTIATRAVVSSLDGDELLQEISRVVRELREALGEAAIAEGVEPRRALVSTPSFAAFQLYSDALTASTQGKLDASIHLLRQALRADSGFAAAWALLANDFAVTRQPDSASHAFRQALRHADRLAPPEADRLRGDAAFHVAHDFEEATRWYRRFLDQRPLSVAGWNNLALYLSALGRHEEALRAFERSATIDPFALGPRPIELLNMSAELVVAGRLDSARALAGKLRGADSSFMRLMLLNASNQWDSLAAASDRLMGSDVTETWLRLPAVLNAAGARAAQGDTAGAAAVLDRAIAQSNGAALRSYLHARLLFDLVRGSRPGWPLPRAAVDDTSVGGQYVRGVYFAQRGDLAAARRAAAALRARRAVAARTLGAGPVYLDALVALHDAHDGQTSGASTELERSLMAAATAGEHDPLSVDRPSGIALRWLAIRQLEARGARTEAAAMRTLLLRPTGMSTAHYALRGFVARARL